GRADELSGGEVPEPAAGHDRLAVGAERAPVKVEDRRANLTRTSQGLADGLSGLGVPELISGQDGLAVEAKPQCFRGDTTVEGEDQLRPGEMTLPGGEIGAGQPLPSGVVAVHGRAPALHEPE